MFRFEKDLKLFGVYLYSIGGKQLYELLQANLVTSLPCPSTVIKCASRVSDPALEGVLRFDELAEFLRTRNLPMTVFISEDGTRIVTRPVYDRSTNKIVGFVGALDKRGLPDTSPFHAVSEEAIRAMFEKYPKAAIGYVIMAQPLQDGCAAFCLGLLGTNNQFSAEDVVRRWNYIKQELARVGITILGFSSDGGKHNRFKGEAYLYGLTFFKLKI